MVAYVNEIGDLNKANIVYNAESVDESQKQLYEDLKLIEADDVGEFDVNMLELIELVVKFGIQKSMKLNH